MVGEIQQPEDIHSRIARAQTRPTVTQVLERMQPDLQRAIPKGLDPDRVSRLALTVIRTSELAKAKGIAKSSLADCTPESFAGSLLTMAALGLEPGTPEGYMVPYRDRRSGMVECQLIIGYQGLIKLFRRHPLGGHIGAEAVYAEDTFDYQYGKDRFLRHRPATGDRGDVVAYYADAELTNGAYEFVVLTPERVKALRNGKIGPSGDIPDPERWMERKTVLRQLLKTLPKSTRVEAALEVDEESGRELAAAQMPARIMETAPALESADRTADAGPPPTGVDPVTGEVLDESATEPVEPAEPPPPPAPKTAPTSPGKRSRGKGSPSPPSRGEPASGDGPGQEGAPARPGPGSSGETGGAGRKKSDTTDLPGRMTVQQRSALTGKWTRLVMMGDREERLLVTTTLLGLEPDALESTSDLTVEQAARLLEILEPIASRDQLDQLLAGQQSLPDDGGGES